MMTFPLQIGRLFLFSFKVLDLHLQLFIQFLNYLMDLSPSLHTFQDSLLRKLKWMQLDGFYIPNSIDLNLAPHLNNLGCF